MELKKDSTLSILKEKIRTIETEENLNKKYVKKEYSVKDLDNDIKKCYRRISLLVSYKERCVEELRERLIKRENFNEKVFDKAIEKALRADIVNDQRYAEIYTLNKFAQYKGTTGVIKHLSDMKIDYSKNEYLKDIIETQIDNEFSNAITLLEQKPPRSKDKYRGAINKLLNRGYPISVSVSAAKTWLSEAI